MIHKSENTVHDKYHPYMFRHRSAICRESTNTEGHKRNNTPLQIMMIIIIIIIIIIHCNWVVTRWQRLFYTYTKYEIGY